MALPNSIPRGRRSVVDPAQAIPHSQLEIHLVRSVHRHPCLCPLDRIRRLREDRLRGPNASRTRILTLVYPSWLDRLPRPRRRHHRTHRRGAGLPRLSPPPHRRAGFRSLATHHLHLARPCRLVPRLRTPAWTLLDRRHARWAMLRRGHIGEAVIAHATTNAFLAGYVLLFHKWHLLS